MFKDFVIKVSIGLESAYLGSAEGLESMMLINGYGHFEESHADEIGSSECGYLLSCGLEFPS